MNLQLGSVHVPTLLAAVVVVIGILGTLGLVLRLLKKI